jgi:hypothetical protein
LGVQVGERVRNSLPSEAANRGRRPTALRDRHVPERDAVLDAGDRRQTCGDRHAATDIRRQTSGDRHQATDIRRQRRPYQGTAGAALGRVGWDANAYPQTDAAGPVMRARWAQARPHHAAHECGDQPESGRRGQVQVSCAATGIQRLRSSRTATEEVPFGVVHVFAPSTSGCTAISRCDWTRRMNARSVTACRPAWHAKHT